MAEESKELKDAKKALEDYLKENPNMQEYQNEIDRMMEKCKDSQTRMNILGMMLQGKMIELRNALGNIQHEILTSLPKEEQEKIHETNKKIEEANKKLVLNKTARRMLH